LVGLGRFELPSITPESVKDFSDWLNAKYSSKQLVYNYLMYSKKYFDCFKNPSIISGLSVTDSVRNNIIKSLIAYSKFSGCYESFRSRLKNCGIHYKKQSAIESFLRIMDSNNHNGLGEWYRKALGILAPNERLFIKYVLLSGLRREEAILSFNLLASMVVSDYYNEQTGFLEHFKIKGKNGKFLFLRNSKNAYVSAIPKSLILEISNAEQIGYHKVVKILNKYGLNSRLQELRSFYATNIRMMGLLSEQVDIMQGRVNGGIFLQYYFKQNPKTLNKRILKLLPKLENKILKQQQTLATPPPPP
jgi:intergrase/recombinase